MQYSDTSMDATADRSERASNTALTNANMRFSDSRNISEIDRSFSASGAVDGSFSTSGAVDGTKTTVTAPPFPGPDPQSTQAQAQMAELALNPALTSASIPETAQTSFSLSVNSAMIGPAILTPGNHKSITEDGSLARSWNESHTVNQQHTYCYCGKDRSLLQPDLQCHRCLNFFHQSCLEIQPSNIIGFMTNYKFSCKNCSLELKESFTRLGPAQWRASIATAMANIFVEKLAVLFPDSDLCSRNQFMLAQNRIYLSVEKDILPFFEREGNWMRLCFEREKLPSFPTTLVNNLHLNRQVFLPKAELQDSSNKAINEEFSLNNIDLFLFRPGYISPLPKDPRKRHSESEDSNKNGKKILAEHLIGSDKPKEEQTASQDVKNSEALKLSLFPAIPRPASAADFKLKPRYPFFSENGFTNVKDQFFMIEDNPFNKRGFRYLPCIADANMPAMVYRHSDMLPARARIDWTDLSSHMFVTKDGLSASTSAGFRMARSNICLRSGDYYFEVHVDRGCGEEDAHVRVGISRREGSLDAPVGFDAYSYGIRDKNGERVHMSRPKTFMNEDVVSGDTLGFHLYLPPPEAAEQLYSKIRKERIPIRYKRQMYFECYEYGATKNMIDLMSPALPPNVTRPAEPTKILGSFLEVFKNGKPMGKAFEDLYSFWPPNSELSGSNEKKTYDDGYLGYFPAISCFKGGIATFNFGPDFKYAIPSGAVPANVRYLEQVVEDVLWDIYDEVQGQIQLEETGNPVVNSLGVKPSESVGGSEVPSPESCHAPMSKSSMVSASFDVRSTGTPIDGSPASAANM